MKSRSRDGLAAKGLFHFNLNFILTCNINTYYVSVHKISEIEISNGSLLIISALSGQRYYLQALI